MAPKAVVFYCCRSTLPCPMPNMAERPGYRTMEMIGGSSVSYLARTPCVPVFCTLLDKGGNRRALRLPGEGGDHFHCTVEPSPGHIRCRVSDIFSEIFSEICPEIRPKISRAFLAGVKVPPPPKITRFFPSEISNFKFQIKFHQKLGIPPWSLFL